MAITQYLTRRFQYGTDVLSQQQSITAADLVSHAVTADIAASGTLTVALSIDYTKLVAVYISTDVTEGCTFNPDGSTATYTVYGNIPYIWSTNCGYSSILTNAFTSTVVTNLSSTDTVNIEMRFLMTP